MTALVIYEPGTADVARYCKGVDGKLIRTHTGFVNDEYTDDRRALSNFLCAPPEGLRIAADPFDPRKHIQDAMRYDGHAHMGFV